MDDEQKLEQQKAAAILAHAGNEEVVRGQVEQAIAESLPYEPHKGPVSAAVMRGELGGNPSLFERQDDADRRL